MGINKVKRAIILAAGVGKRMQPVTLEKPKPLVEVNGVCMIDTVVEALHENGIFEIYVVVGYLKEQFYKWQEKYKGVTLIENPYYMTCNNISSLYVAREHISDCFILDGDQIIRNKEILSAEFDRSGYNAVWTDERTEEWVLEVNDGIVTDCSRTGGESGWQLFSVSRWSDEDGKKLKKHLEKEFDDKLNRNIYWDDIAIFCHPDDYSLGIYPMQFGDVIEIDSLKELSEYDSSYKNLNI